MWCNLRYRDAEFGLSAEAWLHFTQDPGQAAAGGGGQLPGPGHQDAVAWPALCHCPLPALTRLEHGSLPGPDCGNVATKAEPVLGDVAKGRLVH